MEEQLPSLWMASVGGCVERRSGLPPITISLRDSRSIHRSIRCLLDGVSEHSRTLQQELTSSLPAGNPAPCHVALTELAASGSLRAVQMMGAALLWASREPQVAGGCHSFRGAPERRTDQLKCFSHSGTSSLWTIAQWGSSE